MCLKLVVPKYPEKQTLRMDKTEAVLLRNIFEINERVRRDGSFATPLDKADLESVASLISKGGYEAIAICLLHSYINSSHEQIIDAFFKKTASRFGGLKIKRCLARFREYERTMATVMNAMVQPLVGNYISHLRAGLAERNISAPMLIMKSNGRVFPPTEAAPIWRTHGLSGPAAGAIGAAYLGSLCKIKDMITIDIGGTSADLIALIRNGQAAVTTNDAKSMNCLFLFQLLFTQLELEVGLLPAFPESERAGWAKKCWCISWPSGLWERRITTNSD